MKTTAFVREEVPLDPPCVFRYRTEDGVYAGILHKIGPKYAQIITMDSGGIRLHRIDKTELKYMWGIPYDLERAKMLFRDAILRYNKGHVSQPTTEALNANTTSGNS
jgi:hypothetical protein